MKTKTLAATLAAVATCAAPVATQAQEQGPPTIDPTAKATFVGKIVSKGATAKLKVRYTCSNGQGLWISAKQSRTGRRDARLSREGSSRTAASWLHSHRNAITCDGQQHTTSFAIDKVEPGSKGRLRRGTAYVQFCVTAGESLTYSKNAWVKVRRA
jgi:hypothetical protein